MTSLVLRGAVANGTGGATGTSVALAYPPGTAVGDTVIIHGTLAAASTITLTLTGLSGATQIASDQGSANNERRFIWWKTLVTGDLSVVPTLTGSAARNIAGSITAIKGSYYGSLVSSVEEVTATTSGTLPSVTPVEDNDLLIGISSSVGTTNSDMLTSFVPPSGWTVQASAQVKYSTANTSAVVVMTNQLGTGTSGVATSTGPYTWGSTAMRGYDSVVIVRWSTTPVAVQASVPFADRASVPVQSAVRFNDLTSTAIQSAVRFNDLGSIPVQSAVRFADRSSVSTSAAIPFADRVAVPVQASVPFADRGLVQVQASIRFADRAAVAVQAAIPFADRKQIAVSASVPFSDRALVALSASVPFADRALIAVQAGIVWSDGGSTTSVGVSAGIVFADRAIVPISSRVVFADRSITAVQASIPWADRGAVTASAGLVWSDRASVPKSSAIVFADRSTAMKSAGIVFNDLASVLKASGIVFNDLASIGKSSQIVFADLASVGKHSGIVFGDLQGITKTSGIVWSDRQLVNVLAQILWADHSQINPNQVYQPVVLEIPSGLLVILKPGIAQMTLPNTSGQGVLVQPGNIVVTLEKVNA